MTILGLDTASAATAVALTHAGRVFEVRHDPGADERPGHAARLLALVDEVLDQARVELSVVTRIGVGVGPGSFTGLRIGVATARALAQAQGAELVGVSTLRALACGAADQAGAGTVLAVLDARRGEAFAGAWRGAGVVLAPAALAPTALAQAVRGLTRDAGSPLLAVGEGALRFRQQIEVAGAVVPPDGDSLHRVGARHICRLAGEAEPGEPEAVLPHYLRLPDAEINRRQRQR